ncbi:MAG TPA: DUF6600 domain-containing protein [Terriglobales bacterium]|nr:DUF6600 domain-containing protein [Terriglobales bacterium]
MTKLPRSTALLIAALILTTVVPAFAGDPPDRVLRLKYMSGQVSFQPGGVDDWVAATTNRPLTTADRVWTDKESRAELTLATAALRLDSETSLTISNLSDNTVQLELDQGVLNVHVRRMYDGEIYEVDTPNVAFTLLKPGDYRFEVDAVGDTTNVIVRHGKGEGNGNGRGVEVESGEMARFEHGNTLMHTMAQAPRRDGFDDWCEVRDKREDHSQSVQYVSSDVIGYEDLDEYGYWQPVPTYGYVWYPRGVVVGWAPYRYGHWAWIDPWGWTWVDDSPWGFAPFHYGRWIYTSYGWGWCPGPRHYRPIYAPALVAWFGGGGWGVGVSFGGPSVGWVPLGWGEPYYPYYRVSRGYFRNVNIYNTHITNITVIENNYYNRRGHEFENVHYVNQQHGFSAVNTGTLQHGRPVARDMMKVSDRDFQGGHFMRSADVAPTRAAVLGGRENIPAAIPPRRATNRPVVSKMTPPARPDKFEDRAPYIERNRGMSVDKETMSNMRRSGFDGRENRRDSVSTNPPRAEQPTNAETNRPMNVDRPNGNKNIDAANGRPENAGRNVPRPPERSPRVINIDGNTRENAASDNRGQGKSVGGSNEQGTQHYVPRPPERRPVSVDAQGTTTRTGNESSAPEMRRAPENGRSPVFDRNDSGSNVTRETARPSDNNAVRNNGRSPVFDRNNGKDEAESTAPRNVPRPSEPNAVRNDNHTPANVGSPAHVNVDRQSTPQNQPAAERHQDNRPARNVEKAPKEPRQVPRPSENKPAKTDSGNRSSLRPYPSPYSGSYSRAVSYSPRESFSSDRSSSAPRSESYSSHYERDSSSYARPSYSRPSSSYSSSYSRNYSSPANSRSAESRGSYSRPSASYGSRSYNSGGGSYSAGRSYAGGGGRSSGGGGRSYSGGSGGSSRSSVGSTGRHR